MKIHKQTGWGRTNSSTLPCFDYDEFNFDLKNSTKSGLPVGLGRSYGDSSISSNGIYFKSGKRKKIEINTAEMYGICSADVTIGELERAAIKNGLFPLTVPGTEFVTIGGAIASNIHGKSHHLTGAFAGSVIEMDLLTSDGKTRKLKPEGGDSKYFWATLGGMGLTGIITEAKIKLNKIETSYVVVEEKRGENLDQLLDQIKLFNNKFFYTVAWIDLSGDFRGRGIVSGGNHAKIIDLPNRKQKKPFKITQPGKLFIPDIFPSRLINKITVQIFNFFWFKKPQKNGIQDIRKFLHPLDSVGKWNRIYGKKGLIQFQFQVPFGEENFLRKILSIMKDNNLASFLTVLKSFGKADSSLLGFPELGWTLAIDLPAHRIDVYPIFKRLMQDLLEIDGKIYLTKDTLLDKEIFEKMYKNKENWLSIKHELDETNYWQSDQGKRLGLC